MIEIVLWAALAPQEDASAAMQRIAEWMDDAVHRLHRAARRQAPLSEELNSALRDQRQILRTIEEMIDRIDKAPS